MPMRRSYPLKLELKFGYEARYVLHALFVLKKKLLSMKLERLLSKSMADFGSL